MLATAVLASEEGPFDPMEIALHGLGKVALPDGPAVGLTFVHEYPLTAQLLAMTHVWAAPAPAPAVIATKGAPEAIAQLCGLDAATVHDIEAQAVALAREGLRVLGVARAEFAGPPWPADPRTIPLRMAGAGRVRGSAARQRAARDCRMPRRRHPCRDDHRRLCRDRARHRSTGRPVGGHDHHGTRNRGAARRSAARRAHVRRRSSRASRRSRSLPSSRR